MLWGPAGLQYSKALSTLKEVSLRVRRLLGPVRASVEYNYS